MEAKDESLFRLVQDLKLQLAVDESEKMDLDRCRNLTEELQTELSDVENRLKLGMDLYHDFHNTIISRAKAIDALTGESAITTHAVDSLEQAGYDFQRLLKVRDYINREFNRAFSIQKNQHARAIDHTGVNYDEFKC